MLNILFFLKKKISFKNIILIVLTFYVFFFQHHLKFSIINNVNQSIAYAAEISFLILFTVSSFISYLIFKKKILIERFLYIFFVLLFSFNLFNFIKTSSDFEKPSGNINKKIIFKDKLNLKKENIYFFILDAMGPIDKFDKHYKQNNNYFLNYVQKKNYSYFFNSKNFYESTDQNLSVIFHLDTIYDENGNNKYDGMYPSILRSNFPHPNLILNLK